MQKLERYRATVQEGNAYDNNDANQALRVTNRSKGVEKGWKASSVLEIYISRTRVCDALQTQRHLPVTLTTGIP